MRFILNFFIFGLIYFLIWMFFPEAFQTLVSWATQVYNFFHDAYISIMEKTGMHKPSEQTNTTHALGRWVWGLLL